MSRLLRRIHSIGQTQEQARQQLQPVQGVGVSPAGRPGITGGQASPGGTPGVMPEAQVLVYPEPGGDYSTVAYSGLQPMFTADGAAIPANNMGLWAQLVPAGRPHPNTQRGSRAPIAGRGGPPQTGAGRTAW